MSNDATDHPAVLTGAVGAEAGTAEVATPFSRRNRWAYGVGTLGRDMVYTLVSLYLVYYLTEVVNADDSTMWWVTGILLTIRVLDAMLDPIMGAVIDSTRTRWGQFKPWMVIGGLLSAVLTVVLFSDAGLSGTSFLVVFGLVNLLWGISWAANDISYWGMLPALSLDPKQRESLGSVAKIFASIGQFAVVAGLVPLTTALAAGGRGMPRAYQLTAILVSVVMVLGMSITIALVREPRNIDLEGERTGVRELIRALFRNDQLLWTATAYLLFMIGYGTTGAFGLYFFKYAYGDESVFPIFAIFVGVGQILGFAVFGLFSRRWNRGQLYTGSTILVVASYALFMVAPMNLLVLGIAAFALFFAAAFITVLMIAFQADTVEYGQWKLGQRNGAVTFALQPFINKVSGAMNTAIVSATVILAGINRAHSAADVTAGGLWILKISMMVIPAALILVGYLVWRAKFRITEELHDRIVADLATRGDFHQGRPQGSDTMAK